MKVELVYFTQDEAMFSVKNDQYRVVIREKGVNICTCMHGTINIGNEKRCKHLKAVQGYRAKKELV